jgi:hypothetical protein
MPDFLTIKQVEQLTGKSGATIRRFIARAGKTDKIKREKVGRVYVIKIAKELIGENFGIKQTVEKEKTTDQQPTRESKITVELIKTLQEQLKVKDQQIERVQQTLYGHSVMIAKLQEQLFLTAGKTSKDVETAGKGETAKHEQKENKTVLHGRNSRRTQEKKVVGNIEKAKGFFSKLFGN